MRVQQCFSLRRLSLLIKNDIIINRSIIMIVIAAAAGVLSRCPRRTAPTMALTSP